MTRAANLIALGARAYHVTSCHCHGPDRTLQFPAKSVTPTRPFYSSSSIIVGMAPPTTKRAKLDGKLSIIHIAGSPVSKYYSMISVHYARQMLNSASDELTRSSFDFTFAVVLPGGESSPALNLAFFSTPRLLSNVPLVLLYLQARGASQRTSTRRRSRAPSGSLTARPSPSSPPPTTTPPCRTCSAGRGTPPTAPSWT